MNERIKQLHEQATTWALDNYPPPVNTFMWEDLRNEKFAELIVRECIDITLEQKKWVEDMETLNPHDETWNQARIQQSQRIVDKIKEHFGVEE